MFFTMDSMETRIENVSKNIPSSLSISPWDTMTICKMDCGNASNTDSSNLRTL
jgi:hypothetical protein